MKRLVYKAVSHCVKRGKKLISGKHICGDRLMICIHCESIFCVNCDILPGKVKQCCIDAIDAFVDDCGEKRDKQAVYKSKMVKSPRKIKKEKYKIGIIEIFDNNTL